MSLNIFFFLCVFLWNSNVSGNERNCQDVNTEIEILKKLFSDEIYYLKSEIKQLKTQMEIYQNKGNDSLDGKALGK
jgi:hypothetical protein